MIHPLLPGPRPDSARDCFRLPVPRMIEPIGAVRPQHVPCAAGCGCERQPPNNRQLSIGRIAYPINPEPFAAPTNVAPIPCAFLRLCKNLPDRLLGLLQYYPCAPDK